MKSFQLATFCTILLSTILLAQSNPVPLINNPLVPASAAPGGGDFVLTVNGTGFVQGSVVNWNQSALATTFVSGSQLTATVPAADIANAGTASVTVVNQAPGGGTSNVDFFGVRQPFASVSFGESVVSAETTPNWITVADVNSDGKQDLITLTDPTLNVLLGNGDGTFQTPVSYTVERGPWDVIAADFNGDGKLDLAVSTASGFVSILIGNGDGSFLPAQDINLGVELIGLVAGDLDGDGKSDLVVSVNYPVGEVAILLGDGDGTFQDAVVYAAGSSGGGPYFVTTGDFNGDGKLDVAVAVSGDNAVAVLLGNGDGTFQSSVEYPTMATPLDVVVGDFNGDGKLDLAISGYSISVLLGNGDGSFHAPVLYPLPSTGLAIALGDINGDGKLDLVATSLSSRRTGTPNIVVTYLGKGDGSFQQANYFPTGDISVGVAVGDFNGDGLLDFTTANYGTASVLLQSTAVLSQTAVVFPKTRVGSTAIVKVRLSNTGNSSFTISRIGLAGKNTSVFKESNNCGTGLASGASCTIKIVFKPPTADKFLGARVEVRDSAVTVPQTIYLEAESIH